MDFTEGESIYAKLQMELSRLQIGILVNNVGTSHGFGRYTEILTEDDVRRVINCNIMSMTRLTNLVLPKMRRAKKGLILNVGSLLGCWSTPYKTLYGATKV